MKHSAIIAILGLVFVMGSSSAFSQAPPTSAPPAWETSKVLPIEKVGPGVFRIGEIQIHKRARSVTFPAQVNMDKGLLEYLLVRSSGKTHESLLRTQVEPYYLNIAFLLVGFEGTDKPLAEQGAHETPTGEPVDITLIYRDGKKNRKVTAELWLEKREGGKKESPPMDWRYTGSMVMQGTFMAQVDGSIVSIYHDPAALIDHATPGGENDEIWFVRKGIVPAAGTPVTVIVRGRRSKR